MDCGPGRSLRLQFLGKGALLFPDDAIALRATDISSKYSPLARVHSKGPPGSLGYLVGILELGFSSAPGPDGWMRAESGEMRFG